MMLSLKGVKIYSQISNSLFQSKSVTHSVVGLEKIVKAEKVPRERSKVGTDGRNTGGEIEKVR